MITDIDRSYTKRPDNSFVLKYRFKAEYVLGRKLKATEHVHHFNRTQLVICQDISYHRLLHVRYKAYKATGDANKRKCVFCKKYDNLINLTVSISEGVSKYYHRTCASVYKCSLERKYRFDSKYTKSQIYKKSQDFNKSYNKLLKLGIIE